MSGIILTILVAIGIDCTGSCKSNYHMIMTTTAPRLGIYLLNKNNNPMSHEYIYVINLGKCKQISKTTFPSINTHGNLNVVIFF